MARMLLHHRNHFGFINLHSWLLVRCHRFCLCKYSNLNLIHLQGCLEFAGILSCIRVLCSSPSLLNYLKTRQTVGQNVILQALSSPSFPSKWSLLSSHLTQIYLPFSSYSELKQLVTSSSHLLSRFNLQGQCQRIHCCYHSLEI